jgi:hypothetical protein
MHYLLWQSRCFTFVAGVGDLLTYLNVWRGWRDHQRSPKWAYRHFINHKALLRAEDIRIQLRGLLTRLGAPLATCGSDAAPVCQVGLPSCLLDFFQNDLTLQSTCTPESRGPALTITYVATKASVRLYQRKSFLHFLRLI